MEQEKVNTQAVGELTAEAYEGEGGHIRYRLSNGLDLSETEYLMLYVYRARPGITRRELAKLLGITPDWARQVELGLKRRGLMRHIRVDRKEVLIPLPRELTKEEPQ